MEQDETDRALVEGMVPSPVDQYEETIAKADQVEEVYDADFSRELIERAGFIVTALRSHIFKEDNILYPTALQALPPKEGLTIRNEVDQIGYCALTPKRIGG